MPSRDHTIELQNLFLDLSQLSAKGQETGTGYRRNSLVGWIGDDGSRPLLIPRAFRSGRNFSAWIGLVPKQYSSGGKDRLGGISKQGDRYLRGLFVAGALAPNKIARMAWAMMVRGERFKEPRLLPAAA
jgi:Transposase IS116/IS110/IS902 family